MSRVANPYDTASALSVSVAADDSFSHFDVTPGFHTEIYLASTPRKFGQICQQWNKLMSRDPSAFSPSVKASGSSDILSPALRRSILLTEYFWQAGYYDTPSILSPSIVQGELLNLFF